MLRNTKEVFVSPGTTSVFFLGKPYSAKFQNLENFPVQLKKVRVVDLFWNNTFNIHICLDLIHKFDYLGIILYT